MDTLEGQKAATLRLIQAHLADYAQRIAGYNAHIDELEQETSMNHVQAIDGLLESRGIAQCKRVALLSLKRDLEVQHLL